MCLRVEKVPVARFGGRSSLERNLTFRITEGSKLEPACSISANAPFFNRQAHYRILVMIEFTIYR
jgi:hypothetical protein